VAHLVGRHPPADMLPLPCVAAPLIADNARRLLMTTTKHTPRTRTSLDPTPSTGHPAVRPVRDHGPSPAAGRRAASRAPRSGRAHPVPGHPPGAAHPPAETAGTPPGAPAGAAAATLTLQVSAALQRQLEAQAQEEGVSPAQLAAELLAEGLVLRAWDLPGRSDGRAPTPGQKTAPAAAGGRGRGQRPQRQDTRRDRQRAPRPAATSMDDQATFLAYVRQQERQRRS
jgi:hypothetical protein